VLKTDTFPGLELVLNNLKGYGLADVGLSEIDCPFEKICHSVKEIPDGLMDILVERPSEDLENVVAMFFLYKLIED